MSTPIVSPIEEGMMLGEYVVEGLIAAGGMASVYSALHPVIGKRAAIKIMNENLSRDPAAVEAFRQEARDVNLIRHPNIVDVFAFGTLPDGRSYFVMEWLEGESLKSRLRRSRLTLGESWDILIQVCDALDAAHDEHIVHLDLKPDNVYLVPVRGGRTLVKLLDFGIARLFTDGAQPSCKVPEVVLGTPAYISPEQAQGKVVDQKSDCYSFGVMAFEMLLGSRPFSASSLSDMFTQHVGAAPPRPRLLWPEINPTLETLLLDLLSKDPRCRPTLASARQCLLELREASDMVKTQRSPVAAASVVPPGLTRRLELIAIWGVTGLLLCAGWWWFGRQTSFASVRPVASAPSEVNVPRARVEIDGKVVADGDMTSVPVLLSGSGPHSLVITVISAPPGASAMRTER